MPTHQPILHDLLILLIAAVPIAYVSSRLRQPAIIGLMLTGIIIGPYGIGWIKEVEGVDALSEIGVVLLMFTIGLEFSLKRMLEMKRLVILGGGLQVGLTVLVFALISYSTVGTFSRAIYFGFLFALSSTAIVLKTYLDRAEIDAPHGRIAVGILIFQDLCIVPMILLLPVLSGREGVSFGTILIKMGTAIGVVAGIIVTARYVVPFLLTRIVRLRSPEIFILFVVLLSIGTAWLTSQFGLSMALGAFVSGVVLSESEYSHQIVADIMPFRDVFNSIFFVSIGMLLSVDYLSTHLPRVLVVLLITVAGKAILVFLTSKLLGYSLRLSIMVGLGLAQIGEFSFVLAKEGVAQNLLSGDNYQSFLAVSILSMVATPFLIKLAPKLAMFMTRRSSGSEAEKQSLEALDDNVKEKLSNHVIIIGYGNNGRNLAKVLYRVSIPYLVLELNADAVAEARSRGVSIIYGDAVRREVLLYMGVHKARVLVIAISDPAAARHVTALARECNPDLHIVVRTRYISEAAELESLGASQVIPEEFETSVEIFSRVLREYGVSRNVIEREVNEIRKSGYQMLRSSSLPLAELDSIATAFAQTTTDTIFVKAESPVVGKTLRELDLRNRTGVTVTAAVRNGDTEINLGPDFRIDPDDILVVLGRPEQIDSAISFFSGAG